MKYPKRERIRLDKHLYQGPLIIFVTLCFYRDYDVIKNRLANKIIQILKHSAVKYEMVNYAYCLMPNHLHWLFGLSDDRYNALDIIRYFKGKASFELGEQYNTKQLWQDRFYDHILRRNEDIYKQAKYILENPVRKNIADTITSYEYSGGICFEEYQRP